MSFDLFDDNYLNPHISTGDDDRESKYKCSSFSQTGERLTGIIGPEIPPFRAG
ncbi:MAG: hypothetical protein ACXQT4_05875 [Methanotrichaceae archaeon]